MRCPTCSHKKWSEAVGWGNGSIAGGFNGGLCFTELTWPLKRPDLLYGDAVRGSVWVILHDLESS